MIIYRLFVGFSLLFCGAILAVGLRTVFSYNGFKLAVAANQVQLDTLAQEVRVLEDQLRVIDDPDYLDTVIRTQFQVIQPREKVYKILRSSSFQTNQTK